MTGKDFTTTAKQTINPALSFISKQEPTPETPAPANDIPMKRNPLFVETKSKRLQVLMQPSLHARLKKIAYEKGLSFNELLHSTLEAYADEEEKG
ncbi:MAG: hypothetical protein EOL93_06020 [Epsilonproteobacteria bacterium]|nr:hypothetical protein [Campylobacterota bacterium]